MNNKCGLIRKSNPCRCSKKTRALIDSGAVNPHNLMFNKNYVHKIKDVTPFTLRKYSDLIEKKGTLLFAEQPFQCSPDFVLYIRNLINTDSFKQIFNIN